MGVRRLDPQPERVGLGPTVRRVLHYRLTNLPEPRLERAQAAAEVTARIGRRERPDGIEAPAVEFIGSIKEGRAVRPKLSQLSQESQGDRRQEGDW